MPPSEIRCLEVTAYRQGVSASGVLLLVALDLARRPDLRRSLVLAELAAGAALAQQVPTLVQLHLEVAQPRVFLGAVNGAGLHLFAQRVLLVDEGVDLLEQSGVVHGVSSC